jgi:hypothetical protein
LSFVCFGGYFGFLGGFFGFFYRRPGGFMGMPPAAMAAVANGSAMPFVGGSGSGSGGGSGSGSGMPFGSGGGGGGGVPRFDPAKLLLPADVGSVAGEMAETHYAVEITVDVTVGGSQAVSKLCGSEGAFGMALGCLDACIFLFVLVSFGNDVLFFFFFDGGCSALECSALECSALEFSALDVLSSRVRKCFASIVPQRFPHH